MIKRVRNREEHRFTIAADNVCVGQYGWSMVVNFTVKQSFSTKTAHLDSWAAGVILMMNNRTTHLEYEEIPRVISVDELTLDEAHRRVRDAESGNYYYEDRPGIR